MKKLTRSLTILLFVSHLSAYAQLQQPPVPGRPDNLAQAQVDQLLGQGALNVDGFRFDNKRFDFVNFEKGSFRGTTFYNSILNDVICRRKTADPEKLDFEDAYTYACKLKRVSFANWNFPRYTSFADSITDAVFKNCNFTDNKFYSGKFIKVRFNNGLKSSFRNGEFYTCKFDGARFDSVKFEGGTQSASTFLNSNFNAVEFYAILFAKQNSFDSTSFNSGCRLANVKFTSSTLNSVAFGNPGLTVWLEDVSFNNTSWRRGTAIISFNNCTITGAAADIQDVNFSTSVFKSATFGVKNSLYTIPVKRCKFAACTFNGAVTFYNCDLENSTFPPTATLQAAGVKFIGCLNAPYNSPN